jgi:hypothetical protein
MSPIDELTEEMRQIRKIAGPEPIPPVLRDLVQQDDNSAGTFDGTGIHWVSQVPKEYLVDPNNALLVQQYTAEITAYNAKVELLLKRLVQLEEKHGTQ